MSVGGIDKNSDGDDDIKGSCHRNHISSAFPTRKVPAQIVVGEILFGQFDVLWRKIESRHLGSMARELRRIDPYAASYFEDGFVLPSGESQELLTVGVSRIGVIKFPLDFLEKLSRSKLFFRDLNSARILIPVLLQVFYRLLH